MFKETALSFSIQLVNYPQQLAHWGSGAKASLAEADNPEAEVQALEGQSPKGSAGRWDRWDRWPLCDRSHSWEASIIKLLPETLICLPSCLWGPGR